MALVARIKPRAAREILKATAWWRENRPAALGAVESVVQRFVDPILQDTGIVSSSICYFNLLKWRSSIQRHHSDVVQFDAIPRVIGNNIGEPGKEAIRRICKMLAARPSSIE